MNRNSSSPGRALRRLLAFCLLVGSLYWVGRQGFQYWRTYTLFPPHAEIAAVNVAGMTVEQASEAVTAAYQKPVTAMYEGEAVDIKPEDAEFELNLEAMMSAAVTARDSQSHWHRFATYLTYQTIPMDEPPTAVRPIDIPLRASHDPADVRTLVGLMAELFDQPAQAPQLLTTSGAIQEGIDGYVLNRDQAAEAVTAALYQPYNRTVELETIAQEAPELNLSFLESYLRRQMEGFNGIGSMYVLDLQTGEEININADAAISGLSIVKIAIMLETFRAVDGDLGIDQRKLLEETAINSGNYSANLLLDVVAGEDNAYLGVDVLTASMQQLGLESTFIVTPYEEPPRGVKPTLRTPANSRTDIYLDPDPAMQTTAAEMGRLLAMIYDCARGGGNLIAIYPNQLEPDECQQLLDVMTLNVEGNLIRFGVPEDVPVAHKHGWAYNTHGDAGIVFSPGGDYVIVQYLHQDSDWLPANISFPLLRELSRSVYNFFNYEDPYVDHKRAQRVAGQYAAEVTAEALEALYLEETP